MSYKLLTPEQAKILYNLNFIKDSENFYQKVKDHTKTGDYFFYRVELACNATHPMSKSVSIETFPAYDTTELGLFLPNSLTIDGLFYVLIHTHDTVNQYISYYEVMDDLSYDDEDIIKYIGSGETEAQSRASLLIYLIQKNILN